MPLRFTALGLGEWGETEWGAGGGGVMPPSPRETHHEAGAGLCASQLAGARNLAHHQSLKLLQLLEESSVKAKGRHHEGRVRERTRHWVLSGPELQDSRRDFEPELEQSAEGTFPGEEEADARTSQRRVAELPRAQLSHVHGLSSSCAVPS